MRKQSSAALAAKERVGFFRTAWASGMEVKAVYQSSRRWHVFHERYAFCACRTAAAGIRYRGMERRVADGDVAVHEPGEAHCNTFVDKPADFKVLFVAPSLVANAARELGHSPSFHFAPFPIQNDPDLFRKLDRLCTSIEAGGNALEQECLFAATLAALARHAERATGMSPVKNGKRAVERAMTYLRERFNEPVSLDQLAAACSVSRFHLVHAFTREAGLAPHAYQLHVRVEHARGLLQKGLSPAAVAANLGFADQSHFTRHFKRIMQVTPIQYARTAT
jgi:AraC-like DNA-binding protein